MHRPCPLDFLGLVVPDVYYQAVERGRRIVLISHSYKRPMAKVPWLERVNGSKLVQPPHLRLVSESDDPAAHVAAACAKQMVQPEFDAEVPADLWAAVQQCVALRDGNNLERWRTDQRRELQSILSSLEGYGAFIASLMVEGPAKRLASHVNLAFMSFAVEVMGVPDIACVSRWFHGHVIVGDIPDTGWFRPVLRDFEVDSATVLSPESNRVWNTALANSMRERAACASADDVRLLRGVEAQTRKELSKGYVKGPYTAGALHGLFGRDRWRAARRFGVVQGLDDDGCEKIRAIDNERANKLNACTRTHETIAPPSIAFVAMVARLFLFALRRIGCAMMPLAFGLDDMRAAYRMVPVLQAWFTVFALWSFERRRVEYYCLDGHNFGFVAAVLNFNAFAKLVVAFARAFFAVPCDQFFDDFMIVDLLKAGASGQEALGLSLVLLGQRHEPSKRKHMAAVNVGLGIHVNVGVAHTRLVVLASATDARVEAVLGSLRQARAENCLTPSDASSVRGKLGFIFSSAYYRFGQASLQPFTQREYYDSDFAFSPALRDTLEFLEFVLPRLKPLEMKLEPDREPPVVVYTDAMFQWEYPGGPGAPRVPCLRIGWLVFDPKRRAPVFSFYKLPLWYFTHVFAREQETYIAQGEAVGALAPMLSVPLLFKGRAVLQFQDNTGALSALIHGYASRPDMARVVNAFHVAQFGLEARVWLEWVPSKANVADLPSRLLLGRMMELVPGAEYVPTVLPSMHEWLQPLAPFAGGMFSYLASYA